MYSQMQRHPKKLKKLTFALSVIFLLNLPVVREDVTNCETNTTFVLFHLYS